MSALSQNLSASLTGKIPKAILFVRDVDQFSDSEAGMSSTIKSANNIANSLMAKTADALSGSMTLEDISGDGLDNVTEMEGFIALSVQYNPASIRMNTEAGKMARPVAGSMGGGGTTQISFSIMPASTTLDFQLVFDDSNVNDCFTIGNYGLNATNVAKGIKDIVNRDREYSVLPQMEGILSLLVTQQTRQVIFYWAKMSFRGELTSVSSRYTMFNKNGYPVRGVIDLSIRQGNTLSDGGGKEENTFGYNEKYWNDAFNATFGKAEESIFTESTQDTMDALLNGNFLNLNI